MPQYEMYINNELVEFPTCRDAQNDTDAVIKLITRNDTNNSKGVLLSNFLFKPFEGIRLSELGRKDHHKTIIEIFEGKRYEGGTCVAVWYLTVDFSPGFGPYS